MKTTFNVSSRTSLGHFVEGRRFARAFWSLSKKIGLLALNVWQVCLNCSLRVHKNVFGVFLEGSVIAGAFSVSEQKSIFWQKNFCQFCQNCSLREQRIVWRNFFVRRSNCLRVSGLWERISNFWPKNYDRVAKIAFHVSRATFWRKDDKSQIYY